MQHGVEAGQRRRAAAGREGRSATHLPTKQPKDPLKNGDDACEPPRTGMSVRTVSPLSFVTCTSALAHPGKAVAESRKCCAGFEVTLSHF